MGTKSRVLAIPNKIWIQYRLQNGSEFKTTYAINSNVTQTVSYSPDSRGEWKRLIAQGSSATTSLSGKILRVRNRGYYSARFYNVSLFGYQIKESFQYGYLPVSVPTSWSAPANLDTTKAENSAVVNFVRKVKAVNRSFQGGIFLGELAEAVRMVKSPMRTLRGGLDDYVSALKKKRPMIARVPPKRRESVAARVLSDTWLEYSFGWAPLFGDVEDGVKAIYKYARDENRPYLIKVSAVGSSESIAHAKLLVAQTPGLSLEATKTSTFTYKVRYYGAVKSFNPRSQAFNHWGVSLSDFAPTAWELMPWSFFADYFANVGDIIDCASFVRANLAWVNKSKLHSLKESYSPKLLAVPAGSFTSLLGGQAEYEYREVSRAPYTGSFVPTLDFHIPGSGFKWANIAALAPSLRSLTPYR